MGPTCRLFFFPLSRNLSVICRNYTPPTVKKTTPPTNLPPPVVPFALLHDGDFLPDRPELTGAHEVDWGHAERAHYVEDAAVLGLPEGARLRLAAPARPIYRRRWVLSQFLVGGASMHHLWRLMFLINVINVMTGSAESYRPNTSQT